MRRNDFRSDWYLEMTTRLEAPLRREIEVRNEPYTLTITPEGFKLAPKGRRKGYELSWASIVSGEAALASALNASVNATGRAR
jgi:hypothetical protein